MDKAQILVVEDDNIVVMELEDTLQSLGYAVSDVASYGKEAIEKAAERRPDLVLMDIRLKGHINGIDAAQGIRERLDIPVVYLTAYADEDTLQRAKITEPYGYIVKPFEERELYSVIEMALYKHGMERKLKESERWLATTLSSIGDAVIATDERGLIGFMNPVAEALTGWKQEDARGKDLTEVFNIIDEKTRTLAESPATRAIREGVIIRLANHSILIAKDGREIPIDDSAAPIRDDKGEITGVVLTFRDITERKRAEEALRRAHDELEIRVQERTAELAKASEALQAEIAERKRAEEALKGYSERLEEMVEQRTKELRDAQAELIQSEKLAATGRLAASVAHEINNPLQGISNYLSLISQQVAEDHPLREDLEMVKLGFERISEIVRRLRAFYRPAEEEMEPTDINGVVERVLALVGHQLSLGQVAVKRELAEQELLVLGSAGQLEQVLVNLVVNAQEAMPQGGELTVRTALRDDMAQLQVSDTGQGMSEEEMSRLFKPFYSGKEGKGLGLGLWISHNIIEGHGGHIEVESGVSQGTTFTVSLPAYQGGR
jgi:two-component system cell cycle sensor histidine kinase/response regulator CckA